MTITNKNQERNILIFLGLWALINLLQSALTEVHADEAYYWMYSRFLDWGYFDHPPMVALFIKAGDALFHEPLGLRLMTVLTSTLSVWLLWKMLKPYAENARLFILLFSSIVLFHVYGFITTPDAPLGFFIILFFYIYRRYQREDQLKWAVLLALVIAGLLYSKYHALLILFFTVISNLKLLGRWTFWLIVIGAALLFAPHIWWQAEHSYPSFYYHIIDRSASPYRLDFTTGYLLAQLLLAGPLTGWFLYRKAAMRKSSDGFLRAVKFNFFGIFVFFLISTLKGRVEAHWTLPGMLCLFILAYIALAQEKERRWLGALLVVNIALVALVRLFLVVPVPALQKIPVVAYYFNNRQWAGEIREKAGELPVIFYDSFQDPSRYNYYTNTTKGFAYNSRNYRKNQYDIWPLEDSIRYHSAYLVTQQSQGLGAEDTLNTAKGIWYGTRLDQVRIYQKAVVTSSGIPASWRSGQPVTLKIRIRNPYEQPMKLDNTGQEYKCYLEYGYLKEGTLSDFKRVETSFHGLTIAPGATAELSGTIVAPDRPGKYKLVFSLRTEPFRGGRNSDMIPVEVR